MMELHGFFRSSATWRVRIALALKGVAHTPVAHNFREHEQRGPGYLAINPQGLVPALVTAAGIFTQSLAIIEYLDETVPEPPLLPPAPAARAQVRAMAQLIACDIHPVDNLRVLDYLRQRMAADEVAIGEWYRHWVQAGFDALELAVGRCGDGRHCFGEAISLADLCLIPQVYNARRFGTDLTRYPRLVAIDRHLAGQPAFAATAPERQADAV